MAQLVTKGKFSTLSGATRSSIAYHIRKDGKLFNAYDKHLSMIDLEHEDAKKFIQDAQSSGKAEYNTLNKKKTGSRWDKGEISSEDFDNLTIKEICARWGSIPGAHDVLKTRKTLIETELKINQLSQNVGELVKRKEVADVCFSIINDSFKQLLEMPDGIMPRIKALIEGNALDCDIQCVDIIKKQIGKIIKNAKQSIMKKLEEQGELIDSE